MRVRVFLLEFYEQGGIKFPKDPELHKLAVEYTRVAFAEPEKVNLSQYPLTWFACELDNQGVPIRGLGLLSAQQRIDFPLARFTDNVACKELVMRANDHFHDAGMRGQEVFVYIADKEPKQWRCPRWKKWIKAFGMIKAERYLFTIR